MFKCLKAWFYDLSIIKKLLVLLIIGSILPLTIISGYSYVSARKQLLTQACENMNHMNRQINNNINNQIENYLQISGLIYTNSTLKTYLTQEYTYAPDFVEAYDYINDLFYGLMASNGTVHAISLYSTNKSLPPDGNFIHYLHDETTSEWIRELSSSYGNVIYSEIHLDEKGTGFLTLSRIMNFGSLNSPYGVLIISVAEDTLYSMIEEESAQKQIFILNEKGNILSTRDKSLLTKNLEQQIGQDLPSKDGYQIMNIDGESSLVVCNSMLRDWKTVSIVPLNELLSEAKQSAARILFVSLCCFFLALFLMILISHYFNTRIKNLTNQITRIEKEDFESKITIRGNDEIGQLSLAFNDMTDRLNLLINELYKKEIAQRDSELYALQSQINPHFLYNTLSVISSLAIRKGDEEISTIINHLSSFYRTSLNKGKRYISIENEIDITKHYLAIQHMRFRNQFEETYEIDEQLYPCRTLKLILQPFIENAINHAVCERDTPLHIIIRLYQRDKKIYFEVEDDGTGIPFDKVQKLDSGKPEAGFGIYNVNERIQLAYGKQYRVNIYSELGKGTRVQISIPI